MGAGASATAPPYPSVEAAKADGKTDAEIGDYLKANVEAAKKAYTDAEAAVSAAEEAWSATMEAGDDAAMEAAMKKKEDASAAAAAATKALVVAKKALKAHTTEAVPAAAGAEEKAAEAAPAAAGAEEKTAEAAKSRDYPMSPKEVTKEFLTRCFGAEVASFDIDTSTLEGGVLVRAGVFALPP